MTDGRGRSRWWLWGFGFAAVGACGGNVGSNDHTSQAGGAGGTEGTTEGPINPVSQGGRAGQGTHPVVGTARAGAGGDGGDRGYMPPRRPSCEAGAPGAGGNLPHYSCDDWEDVVCSWQRVTIARGTGDEGGASPCEAAEALFDPSGAPEGGAGGAFPDRNACASYVAVPRQVDRCDGTVTSEHHDGECNIAGHCCVLVSVRYCGP